MTTHYNNLRAHLKEISNLSGISSLLGFDRNTVMASGGAEARASQIATISRISHELFTSDETAKLLEAAANEIADSEPDSDEARLITVTRYDYEQATKLPTEFVTEQARVRSLSQMAWANARKANDFSIFRDYLKQSIEIALQEAELRGYQDHPYDALLNKFEQGMTSAEVTSVFDAHRPDLIELIAAIAEAPQVDDSFLHQPFDIAKQKEITSEWVSLFGYDFDRGGIAVSAHPFTTAIASVNDVRFTARYDDNWLNMGLFSMFHEAGHGIHGQGYSNNLIGTPLAGGPSSGVNESQSRLYENIIGRSKGFWSWALPKLQATFPQLANVSLDQFYKGINKSEPSFIRVEADEVTYNLHIMLRFEFEMDILAGKLEVDDLPEAWNSRFHEFFGITPPTDTVGVLQDVHWSVGIMGYFPTYALGNLLSNQYYNEALKQHPQIPDEIASGKFDTITTWMRENVHTHGRKFTGKELTQRITGGTIQSDDYIAYLKSKYGGIYGLD